jgi:hypothetical protein
MRYTLNILDRLEFEPQTFAISVNNSGGIMSCESFIVYLNGDLCLTQSRRYAEKLLEILLQSTINVPTELVRES